MFGNDPMKTAVISFVFPIAEPFYKETMQSIYQQSDNDFDTIIVDDGLGVKDLPQHIRHLHNTQNVTPLKLREIIFNKLIDENYDLLISIDSDDIMSKDRVEKTKKIFSLAPRSGFYYSKLNYMSMPEKEFFCLPDKVTDIHQLLKHNFVGLSHTSLNLKVLRDNNLSFCFPNQVIALDWYLASWYLFQGFKGSLSDGTVYYRLYKDNIAGEMSSKSYEEIKRIINIKINHYSSILTLYRQSPLDLSINEEIGRLKKLNSMPKNKLLQYIKNSTSKIKNNYWWAGY